MLQHLSLLTNVLASAPSTRKGLEECRRRLPVAVIVFALTDRGYAEKLPSKSLQRSVSLPRPTPS